WWLTPRRHSRSVAGPRRGHSASIESPRGHPSRTPYGRAGSPQRYVEYAKLSNSSEGSASDSSVTEETRSLQLVLMRLSSPPFRVTVNSGALGLRSLNLQSVLRGLYMSRPWNMRSKANRN